MMKRKHITMLAATALLAAMAFSCAKNTEEEAPEVRPTGKLTSIEAYIVQPEDPEATKTTYETEGDKAVFSWLDGDHIDAVVTNGTSLSSVVFTKQIENNLFQDGHVDGQATLAQRSGYSLGDWAFYPSRVSPEAQAGGFIADWSYEGGAFKMDLPASITRPSALKPMSAVPMVGKRDADGKYAFTQPVGVLAVPVKNLPMEADFISIHSESVALAGCFTLAEGSDGVLSIASRAAASDAEKTLTQHFSGLQGAHTFYFAVPYGEIPAGLVLTVGSTADPDLRMTKTTQRDMTVARGHIVKTPELTFEAVNQQWEDYGTGMFKDDFIWAQHSWNTSIWIPVTIQRSGLHPEKYRIANPYTKACTTFGYTPYTQGVESDDYFVYFIQDGVVSYSTFRTGVEDLVSGGKPMMITYSKNWSSTKTGSETKIVRQLTDGTVIELQFGAVYSQYENPAAYMYTRDGEGNSSTQRIHLVIDDNTPESWNSIGDCTFIDNYIWPYEGLTAPVTRDIQQYSHNANRFRIAKPYPASDADEWFEFDVSDPTYVTSVNYYTGTTVNDETNTSISWKAVIWNGAYGAPDYSNVISTQANGLPLEVQIGPCYRDSEGVFDTYTDWSNPEKYYYEVGKDHEPRVIDIIFPHTEETWTSLGKGRYMDEWFWKNNSFAPYNVEVEIWRSDLDPNRYRVANPYTVANKAFKRTAVAGADEYLYLSVNPSTSLVTYETLRTGMDRSGSDGRNLAAAHPTIWNAMKGTSLDASTTKVASGSAAAPLEIQLGGVYYDSADDSHFYTNSTGLKHLWFPDYFVGETWSDYCEGTYVDGTYDANINGSDAIGTVAVTIQQSSLDDKRFRVANPYRANVDPEYLCNSGIYDEYLYFNYSTLNDFAYSEPFRPGVKMNPSSYPTYELGMYHPVNSNLMGWSQGGSDFAQSSVKAKNPDGSPNQIRLGLHYFDIATPTPGYCYTRQGSGRPDSERVIITFGSSYDAIATAYELPLKPAFHNPVVSLSAPNGTLERIVVKITGDLTKVTGLRLWQDNIGGWMNGAYVAPDPSTGIVTIDSFSNATIAGSIDLNFWATEVMGYSFKFEILEMVVDGASLVISQDSSIPHVGGVVVNNGGDTEMIGGNAVTISSFRIPALVTSNAGTLIAAYDVRYDHSGDLQADIDVGVKRSTDGGKTWSPLIIAMDMGIYGYEAEVAAGTMTEKQAQLNNGIGDPCLLVDENTGRLFCFAVWTHGHYNDADHRSLAYAGKGFEIDDTPQFMMAYSDDDGVTWSEPVNITRQIKKNDWRMTFQGPGRGITMKDGTLVIPIQHQEGESMTMHGLYPLNSGIAYSTDHGETWHTHNFACPVTSECAVAEIEPGVLLLTMRDETDSHYRRNYVTTDLGRTWTAHSSNGKWLDSTCEASILHVDASKNVLGQDLVLFSNPHNTSRSRMTIQASLDKGGSFASSLLIDSGGSLGYSCLTMIDDSTVGILYESSRASIFFQAIPLTDIVK